MIENNGLRSGQPRSVAFGTFLLQIKFTQDVQQRGASRTTRWNGTHWWLSEFGIRQTREASGPLHTVVSVVFYTDWPLRYVRSIRFHHTDWSSCLTGNYFQRFAHVSYTLRSGNKLSCSCQKGFLFPSALFITSWSAWVMGLSEILTRVCDDTERATRLIFLP